MVSKEQISKAKILIVDDEVLSIKLLTDILQKAGHKNVRSTTHSADTKALYQSYQPDVLILDLMMPDLDGFGVMEQLKKDLEEDYLPIVVISGEETSEARYRALNSGAKDFINKPFDRTEVLMRIHNILEVRMLHNEVKDQNKILEQKVKDRTQELYDTQLDVIQRLARAIEYRDSETGMHIIRMSNYSACLAAKVGLSMQECDMVLTASPLHDIGKIGIPDSILCKPGKLTDQEFEIMKTHTTIGGELLSGSNSQFLNIAKNIALSHHEKWDGSGYPNGLKGEEIPMTGRICGVCDVFDALTTKRPYKKAWSNEETIEEIKSQKGRHFDPKIIDSFMDIYPQIINIQNKYIDPEVENDNEQS